MVYSISMLPELAQPCFRKGDRLLLRIFQIDLGPLTDV
jgi:hypothetical protein